MRYNSLLHENYRDYVNARKGSKKDVLKKIVAAIEEGGGRFLDKHNDKDSHWVVMSKEKVYTKVSQGIRDLRVAGDSAATKKKPGPKPKTSPMSMGLKRRFDPKKSSILQRKFPDNGTLPGQPRRLSFAERVKLLEREQRRAMNGGSDNSDDEDGSDADVEEADEDVSEDEASVHEVQESADANASKADEKPPAAAVAQVEESIGSAIGPVDAPDDVSETETEDSFPTQRSKETPKSETNDKGSDDDL